MVFLVTTILICDVLIRINSEHVSTGSAIQVIVNNGSCFLQYPPKPQYERCLLPSAKPLYNYMEEIQAIFDVPFWIPVRKNEFSFKWTEPSLFYGQQFVDNNQIIKQDEAGDCLVYYNSTVIQAANCNDSYNSFCVYDATDCSDNATKKINNNATVSLKLVKSAKNASRLFLAIEYEKNLKTLGQYPFKCFVDLNVSSVRVLYNTDIISFGNYKNISMYGFSTLNSLTSNYWCEAFSSYDLTMMSSNRIHITPCDSNNSYEFTVALDYMSQDITDLLYKSEENFCVEAVAIQNNSLRLTVAANKTADEVITFFQNKMTTSTMNSRTTEIFCFNFHDLLRNATYTTRIAPVCIKLHFTTAITDQIVDIVNSSYTPSESMHKLLQISESHSRFSALDVYLTALIFRKFSSSNIDANIATSIVHHIMEIKRTVLRESQHCYNATSILLYRFDKILANAEMVNVTDYVQINEGSVMSLVANLKNANLGGIASYNYSGNVSVVVLSKTTLVEELLSDPNLHSAIILPDITSGETLDMSDEDSKLALTFYLKDSLFNVEDSGNIKEVSSIFGATLKGYHGTLHNPILVIFRSSGYKNQTCAYWKLNKTSNEIIMNGHWVIENGEVLSKNTDFVVCKYYKLAHFTLLIFEDVYQTMDSYLIEMLEDITIVNSAFSLFGAIGIILTAILFKSWRKNKGNLVLMNFVLSICLQVISLHVSNYVNDQNSDGICSAVGAILHYSVLSEFCWMLVIAVLQYKRYVQVFTSQPDHLMTKACVTGWIVPLVPVTALIIAQPYNYTKSLAGLCYPAQLALYLTVFFPVGSILIINIIIYVLIIFDIFSVRKRCVKKELIFQWLIVVLLFFMLGVTWAFAFLGYFFKSSLLMFVFSITSSLQGFVIFLFFIVFNKKTRNMYMRWLQNYLKKNDVSNKTNTIEKF